MSFSIFILVLLIVFLFLIQPLHELGHYVFAMIYGYQPCAMLLNLCIFPGATLFLKDVEETNRIFKLSGLFFPILVIPLLAIFFGMLEFPVYKSYLFWSGYLLLAVISTGRDIELVLEDIFERKISIPLVGWFAKGDENVFSCSLVTSREIWEKWKEKYSETYEKRVDREFQLI